MIPIFSDANSEMENGNNHEPAEFLEFIDELISKKKVEKGHNVLKLLKAIKENEETEFLSYDELKEVNDYIIRTYGDRPKGEYGELIPWNEILDDY